MMLFAMLTTPPFAIITCAAGIIGFYAATDRILARFVRPMLLSAPMSRRHSIREMEGMIRALSWSAGLVVLFFAVAAALGIGGAQLIDSSITMNLPLYALFGVLVGLGEAAVSSQLCLAATNNGSGSAPLSSPLRSLRSLPLPVRAFVVVASACAEECTLRGALLVAAKPYSGGFALLISVGVSLSVQAFSGAPGRRSIFPFIGAFVTAPTHALLFLAVPDIRPIVLAQIVATLVNES
jgi:hypothetical protein